MHTCSFLAQTPNMSEPVDTCSQCGRAVLRGYRWRDAWYCDKRCAHAAGDRSCCSGWDCGCTGYAKKRRLLRQHRAEMRVMDDVIDSAGLQEWVEEEGIDRFWLGLDDRPGGLDEDSDGEDPEAIAKQQVRELRQEAADRRAFVEAAQGALENRGIATDLERARMRLEDHRALGLA